MVFLQTYAKEIFSLLIPLITWILNNKFKARAKLLSTTPHKFTFIVQEPLREPDGKIVSPNQTVHTASHIIMNSGKETATKIELVFNWKPPCINIWPIRHYTEHTEPDNRYVMIFDSLAPNEQIGLEALSINNELPRLLNVRSDQCVATEILMYPQPMVANWKRRIAVTLLFFGFSFAIYVSILLLQFLIAKTPIGI